MGILSWWSGKEAPAASKTQQISSDTKTGKNSAEEKPEVVSSDMNNGAMEVIRRPDDFTVFEFGSAVDKVTLAGYCSVSEELEPCRWEILPGTGSDAPQFRVKNDVPEDLPEYLRDDKPVISGRKWSQIVYFHETGFEDLIIKCKKDIEACQKVYTEASKFFETKFGGLEKIRPGRVTSTVIRCFCDIREEVMEDLDKAYALLPHFTEYVNTYVQFRNGPFAYFQLVEDRYSKNLEQLAEIPNVEKMIKELLYNEKDDKKIEQRSGLTRRDIYRIIGILQWNKNIFIPYRKDDKVNEEEYGEMEDLLIQLKALMKDLPSIRHDYETAKYNVKEHVEKYGFGVIDYLLPMELALKQVERCLRIMRQQLKLLIQKNVILKDYDKDFEKEWLGIYCRRKMQYC